MTVTTTDFEVFVGAHPVDAIPCDWTQEGWEDDCAEARWSVNLVPHCKGDTCHHLICDRCKDYLFEPDADLECYACGAAAAAREVLISISRLEAK